MATKFNVGDRVSTEFGSANVVYVSIKDLYNPIYCIEFDDLHIALFTERDLTMITPFQHDQHLNIAESLPVFNENDLVEYSDEVYEFIGYYGRLGCVLRDYSNSICKVPKLKVKPYKGVI